MKDMLAMHDLYKEKLNHAILASPLIDIAPIVDALEDALGFITTRWNCDEQGGT
jgi:hypothetical protein